MEFMKFTGKTEEDALTEAKIALGATTDEIEYEVLFLELEASRQ